MTTNQNSAFNIDIVGFTVSHSFGHPFLCYFLFVVTQQKHDGKFVRRSSTRSSHHGNNQSGTSFFILSGVFKKKFCCWFSFFA